MNWEPFLVLTDTKTLPPSPREIHTFEGIGDRLRAAAFAEIQAREAFLWAKNTFSDASENLKSTWVGLSKAEDKHLSWLLKRMKELGVEPHARAVSLRLWESFMSCKTALEFSVFMANAEERGRKAGERFYQSILKKDPITAEIFRKIAEEEIEHILTVKKFFPEAAPIFLKN